MLFRSVASRRLPAATLHDVQGVIRDSLSYALAHRDETLSTMRRHAQEQADDVLWKHVDLYVNQWTLDLGAEGRRALGELADRAAAVGTGGHGRLEVLAG